MEPPNTNKTLINQLDQETSQVNTLVSSNDGLSRVTQDLKLVCESIGKSVQLLKNISPSIVLESCDSITKFLQSFNQLFSYCKNNGEKCMKDEELSKEIALLFKLAFQNLKVVLEAFIRCFDINFQINNGSILKNLFVQLMKIASVLTTLEMNACLYVWKALKKMAVSMREIDLFDIVKCLHEILEIIHQKLGESNGNEKDHKVFIAFTNIFIFYLQETRYALNEEIVSILFQHAESILEILKKNNDARLMNISKKFLSSINDIIVGYPESPKIVQERLHHSLSPACFSALLEQFVTDDFAIYDIWMERSSVNLIELIFMYVKAWIGEFFSENHYYEEFLCKTCCFVTNILPRHFHILEEHLVNNILGDDFFCYMFAADLWCFIARFECLKEAKPLNKLDIQYFNVNYTMSMWADPKLCFDHFVFVGKMVVQLCLENTDERVFSNVSLLLKRLFYFLPNSFHIDICNIFEPSVNTLCIWKLLPILKMQINESVNICVNLLQAIFTVFEQQEHNMILVEACECASALVIDSSNMISDNCLQHMLAFVHGFWSDCLSQSSLSESVLISVLHLTTVLTVIDIQALSHNLILDAVAKISSQTESFSFLLASCQYISELKKVHFPTNIERSCLEKIEIIFNKAFSFDNHMLHYEAMMSLKQFAEVTPYTNVLAKLLPSSKKKEFAAFLKKVIPSEQNDNGIHLKVSKLLLEMEKSTDEFQHKEINEVLARIKSDVNALHDLLDKPIDTDVFKVEIDNISSLWKQVTDIIE